MDLKSKFYTIFKALNPYNYQELVQAKFWHILKYYFFIIVFSVLVMFILFLPSLYYTGDYISRGVKHFDNLTVNSDFKLKDSFNILSDPVIRFDNTDKNMTDEMVLITPDAVTYKHYFIFGQQREISLTHGVDVATSARVRNLISLGVFFMLPALFFWAIIFSLIYFGIIILITLLLVLIFAGLFHVEATILKFLKLCIYASTIFILLQLILMPFFRMFLIPLAAYWILVLIILFLWHDHPPSSGRHNEDGSENVFTHGSKTKDIFGAKENSGFKSKNKIEAKDEYDVDENGNIKGASKKHKNVDEENDGYVEL